MIEKVEPLYEDFVQRGTKGQHILVVGMTGSGKSVLLNGIIHSILRKDLDRHRIVLIDLKRVEFNRYRNTRHCAGVATTYEEAEHILDRVRYLIQRRVENMDKRGIDVWDGATLHLIIDELAELVLQDKKIVSQLQSICQLGRAAGIQVICATQCPLAEIIPTKVKVNFPIIVGLHTAFAKHSRNILEINGCEELPLYGEALIMYPTTGITRVSVPMINRGTITSAINNDLRGTG